MFYGLNNVTEHPSFKLQEIVNAMLWAAVNGEVFSDKIFPAWFKVTYNRATTLQSDLKSVYTKLLKINTPRRKKLYSQFVNNNAIDLICGDDSVFIESSINWKKQPEKSLDLLMIDLYSRLDLATFKIKGCKKKPLQRYYSDFIKVNHYVCPFCFINNYKNRLSPRREDLDHYFCKSSYPLAAANMDNLVPMCSECNQTYKKEKLIPEDAKSRVKAFYPYSSIPDMELRITCIRYPSTTNVNDKGEWNAELICSDPAQQCKVDTWNRVFDIKQRISIEIEEFHGEWIYGKLEDEMPAPFPDLPAFRTYLLTVSDQQTRAATRRNEPKTLIKAALYKYLSEFGNDIFLKSIMRQHEVLHTMAA